MARYRNSFHKPENPSFGPEFYETDARPTAHRGFEIFQRVRGRVWDCVINGECVGQYAGPNGAKRFVDQYWSGAQ